MSAQHKNQVRIIGGQYKRRILKFPDSLALRPTPDRVRETLFNWLGQDCTGMTCLDLFSGSGALGFEAASRHAKKVVMIEAAKPVFNAIKSNKELLNANHIELYCGTAERFLSTSVEQFDLILLDPPFATELLSQILPQIASHLSTDGQVYIECEQWPELTDWQILREGKAGAVKYALLCRASA